MIRDREPERHNTLAEIALAEKRYPDAMAEFRLGDRRPDGPVNGCAACLPAYLARAFDLSLGTIDYFNDDDRSPHQTDIHRLAASGITGGCGAGN